MSDLTTTVVGYLLQAVGILAYSLARRKALFIPAVGLYFLFLVPCAISHSYIGAIVFGLINSVLCGVIAGHYLCRLAQEVESKFVASAFGIGYASASVLSWLMASLSVNILLIICFALSVSVVILNIKSEELFTQSDKSKPIFNSTSALIAVLIIVFSLVNNVGFYFQSTDSSTALGIEFSRTFYAAGLIAAGLLSDKSRKYGAVCALASLAVPFITLSLRGETLPLTIFWALSYFAFGFYSVFRVVVFVDSAKASNLIFLSGFGLLFGRIGDAAGAGLSLALKTNRIALVILAAMLFGLSVFLFFIFYQRNYTPEMSKQKSEIEKFNAYASQHDLSRREREILRLLFAEKTNKEIAELLYISESTVKFHIHNLLKKTGAKNRFELLSLYDESAQE